MSRAEKDAAKQQAKEQQRMDLVSRLAIHSIKASTSTARTSLGLVAGNKRAMAALRDIPGAQGLVKGADGVLNPGKARNQKPQQQQQQEQQYSEVQGKKSPPPPPEKKMGGGLSGFSGKVSRSQDEMGGGRLIECQSFGHMTSMFKDTPKGV